MRKLKVFSIILLIISTGAFIAFQGYTRVVRDNKPPVVTCESEELTTTVGADENELLKGVTAKDKRSGDVSDTLVIESISDFTDVGTRVITYAAVDKSKNVGRCERTLIYEDYQPPVFRMTKPLCFSVGETINIMSCMAAESVLDGDLTSNIKYSLEKTVNTMVEGEYPVEFRVLDSAGNTVYLKTQISISEKSYSGIKVSLSDYLVYVPVGAGFSPEAYYAGADKDGVLSIQSNVNTAEAGTYYVDYIVNGAVSNGKSRLVVVVQ